MSSMPEMMQVTEGVIKPESSSTDHPTLARDRVAQAYFGMWGGEETATATRERIDWIFSQIVGKRVLDIGCSEGILALLLAKDGKTVVGVDINKDALDYARRLLSEAGSDIDSRVRFVVGDFLTLDLEEVGCDTVVITEVLEHLVDPAEFVDRALRHLQPGGRIVITTPFGLMPDPDHRQTFTLSSFCSLLHDRVAPIQLSVRGRYICFVGEKGGDCATLWREYDPARILALTEEGTLGVQEILHKRISGIKSRLEIAWAQQQKVSAKPAATLPSDSLLATDTKVALPASDEKILRQRLQKNLSKLIIAEQKLSVLENERAVLAEENSRLQKLHEEFSASLKTWSKQLTRPRTNKSDNGVAQLESQVRYAEFLAHFERFRSSVINSDARELFFVFSGTTFIQNIRANRPIRLTHCLLQQGVPVLFSYHRWKETDEIPAYRGDLLFQSPVDYTLQLIESLASADFGDKKRCFVVSYPHPEICRLLNRFNMNGWTTIYDCRDDWEAFEKVGMAKWFKSWAEKYVVRNCDAVTCVSAPLQRKMQQYDATKRIELLPNGYDTTFRSPDFKRVPSATPTIGYFGHLTSAWFDWESLIAVAKLRPQFRFELIGHGSPKDLVLPENMRLLGPQPHERINEIAQSWSAAIICFKMGKLADGVDPIKIYEYLSLGLPVVSFRMPQIDDYPFTTTVESVSDFASALDHAIGLKPRQAEIEEWLSKNTWELRAQRHREILEQFSAQPPVEKILNLLENPTPQ